MSKELWKALRETKQKYKAWSSAGKPRSPDNKLFENKKNAKKELRRVFQMEQRTASIEKKTRSHGI